jgi:cobalt-zinc-cadmium efflux system protein
MHSHDHPHDLQARGRLIATFGVTACIAVAEVVGGLTSGSLALLADAGHMLFDLLALAVAIAALAMGSRPADARHTWGYRRIEVLGALVNGLLLVGVSVGIACEAVSRWMAPQPLAVGTMMGVATIGLVANLISLAILGSHHSNMGVRAALLHVLGDTLSSVGVLVGGAAIFYTGYTRIDAVLSGLIAVVLVVSSVNLLRDVANILLEAAPRHMDTDAVRRAVTAVPGVHRVHDMHLWSITSGLPALSAHVELEAGHRRDGDAVRLDLEAVLRHQFGIVHTTLQMEAAQARPVAEGAPAAHKAELPHAR